MRDWARHLGRGLRLGLPALALYALLLQAFLTGAAPAAAFNPADVLCAELAAGTAPSAPGAPAGPHHPAPCLAQCSVAFAPFFTEVRAPALPVRLALPAHAAPPADAPTRRTRHPYGPGARAPPQA